MERRGFLKLLGAAVAVPIVAGLPLDVRATPREITLPAGAVVETLATARTIEDAVRQAPAEHWVRGDDEYDWRERYRERVRREIEIAEYEKITFVVNTKSFARKHLGVEGMSMATVGAIYELGGPLIATRQFDVHFDYDNWLEELPVRKVLGSNDQVAALGSTRHVGIAHVVARRIGEAVEEDVLTQLLTLRAQAGA